MSHPALFRLARSGDLDYVGGGGSRARAEERAQAPPVFAGEVLTERKERFSEKYHFADKAKREEGGGKSDGGDSKKSKKDPIHKKGSDADGDGKKNESKKRDRNEDGDDSDSWDDKDGDGKPNKVDKDKGKEKEKKGDGEKK